jgi:hypothetical protein
MESPEKIQSSGLDKSLLIISRFFEPVIHKTRMIPPHQESHNDTKQELIPPSRNPKKAAGRKATISDIEVNLD